VRRISLFPWAVSMVLVACSSTNHPDTIAKLRYMDVGIEEEQIDDGLEKAMSSYERFVEEHPDSGLTPEAIRRLADLKLEKEYGTLTPGVGSVQSPQELTEAEGTARPGHPAPAISPSDETMTGMTAQDGPGADPGGRTTQWSEVDPGGPAFEEHTAVANDLEKPGTREAITLYKKLLADYPQYASNDQVLYQMSRAYEEMGLNEEAMQVMDQMVRDTPDSRYFDEVQFRRAEYFFVHRRYLDAEEAYTSIVNIGVRSSFYELALYKLGWTYYKQELYENALDRFVALMDHKVSVGYDFDQTEDEQERKRTDDTLRIISLSFSNLGGSSSVVEYFSLHGKRMYEDRVYGNLAEFYFDKRRYADAAATYNAFVDRNPSHRMAPIFHMRVIDIHAAGGFPSLVLDSKKKFATTYGLKADYWNHFESGDRPEVLDLLKTNLSDLANHYHACYQDPNQTEDKQANFEEAAHWYREFLASFPEDNEAPTINYQLAGLLLENGAFGPAAVEFEKTAYSYPTLDKASEAGLAAVSAYREQLITVAPVEQDAARWDVIRSSLKFADTFPEHEKAAIVLGAASDDLYGIKEYERALEAATKLLKVFPETDVGVLRSAWLVVGHSSYELMRYQEAEDAYINLLALMPEEDENRNALYDNLAASIYKQGEEAVASGDQRMAADHFLRVARLAPTSKIRPNAEYDAAAALIQLKDWETAGSVLLGFRANFPDNPLQAEVTKKIAYVYKENEQFSLAASEYERIETESQDDEVRREALLFAAELYEKDGDSDRALEVYRRYVSYFPQPVEFNVETRNKIAEILKTKNEYESYLQELETIVSIDADAGNARTPRTRYLGARAALVLAQRDYEAFLDVRLIEPFEENLRKKRELMKTATERFSELLDYEIGETTAAGTFYLAEIYAHFSEALMTSARPEGLSPMEREQYELAIEEQAYPFEEKAIQVHESNLALISQGIYNEWIQKSLEKLAIFVPARYDKQEEGSGIVDSLETYIFEIDRPFPSETEVAESSEGSKDTTEAGPTAEASGTGETAIVESTAAPEPEKSEPAGTAEEPKGVTEASEPETVPAEEAAEVIEAETVESAVEPEPVESEPAETVEEPKVVTEAAEREATQAEEAAAVSAAETAESAVEPEPAESEAAGTVEEPKVVTDVAEPEPVPATDAAAVSEAETAESAVKPEPAESEPVGTVEEPKVVTDAAEPEPVPAEEAATVSEAETVESAVEPETAESEPAGITEEPKVVTDAAEPEATQVEEASVFSEVEAVESAIEVQVETPSVITDEAAGR